MAGLTELLAKYKASLPELFNVSQVELDVRPMTVGHKEIRVDVAPDTKCERCWRYVPDVGEEADYPTVCLRCAEALTALSFPPYTAEPAAEQKAGAAE